MPKARNDRRPTTAFVLGGGANLGATQVGMLRALFERGIEPDHVIGCSVGAINGAVLAADPSLDGVALLESLWRNLDGDTICPAGRINALRLLAKRYGTLETNDGLRKLLEARLPYRRFEDVVVPQHVVATSLHSGREEWRSSSVSRSPATCASPWRRNTRPPTSNCSCYLHTTLARASATTTSAAPTS